MSNRTNTAKKEYTYYVFDDEYDLCEKSIVCTTSVESALKIIHKRFPNIKDDCIEYEIDEIIPKKHDCIKKFFTITDEMKDIAITRDEYQAFFDTVEYVKAEIKLNGEIELGYEDGYHGEYNDVYTVTFKKLQDFLDKQNSGYNGDAYELQNEDIYCCIESIIQKYEQ